MRSEEKYILPPLTPEQEKNLRSSFARHKGELCDICGELTDIETTIRRRRKMEEWPDGVYFPGVILSNGKHGHVECFYRSGNLKPPMKGDIDG